MNILSVFRSDERNSQIDVVTQTGGYRSVMDALNGKGNMRTFLHNTNDQDAANSIINNGFRFAERLGYTTDIISGSDNIDLHNWDKDRNYYGPYTVIIQVDDGVYERLVSDESISKRGLDPEHVLSKDRYYDDDEYEDYVYTLNEKFVKGYVDRNTGKFYSNPNFNPSYFDDAMIEGKSDWNPNKELAEFNSRTTLKSA